MRSYKKVVVVGAGMAGMAAATSLARAGALVTVVESRPQLGGRWSTPKHLELTHGGQTVTLPIEHGLHGIWRRYFNLRALIDSVGASGHLRPAAHQELIIKRADGSPSFIEVGAIVRRSRLPHFAASGAMLLQREWLDHEGLVRGLLPTATAMLHVLAFDPRRDVAYYDQYTVAQFLRSFPPPMRRLFRALTHSGFFAEAEQVSLAAFFCGLWLYAVSDRRDCGFDVLDGTGAEVVLSRLADVIDNTGGAIHLGRSVARICTRDGAAVGVDLDDGTHLAADAVVLAVDPPGLSALAKGCAPLASGLRGARIPEGLPSVAVRTFLTRGPASARAAAGLFGDGDADNYFWLDQLLDPYRRWREISGEACIESHLYGDRAKAALTEPEAITRARLERSIRWAFPEAGAVKRIEILRNPATHVAFGPGVMSRLPAAEVPGLSGLALCGDFIACQQPVLYLERATITGLEAAKLVGEGLGLSDLTPIVEACEAPLGTRLSRGVSRLARRAGLHGLVARI